MAKRPPAGRCVHCLKTCDLLTWDHGIPVSWYPDGHSGAKIKAPSCRDCQERLQRIEKAVLVPLALSLDPSDPLTRGVPQAVMRSLDPEQAVKPGMSAAAIDREKRARQALRGQVQAKMFETDSAHGAFPGFGPEHVSGSRVAMVGPHINEIRALGEKFIRVALWVMRNHQFVEPDYVTVTDVIDINTVPDVEALIRKGDAMDIFPGVRVTIRTASDQPRTHMSLFELWGRFKLFVSVVEASPSNARP
jgi:hypothetical protein